MGDLQSDCMKLPVGVLGSPCDCGEPRVRLLHPGVTVLGGKVRALVCVSMWMCAQHFKPRPGSWGGWGRLPQVGGYPRASLWVCSAVTETQGSGPRKDVGSNALCASTGKGLELGFSKAESPYLQNRKSCCEDSRSYVSGPGAQAWPAGRA